MSTELLSPAGSLQHMRYAFAFGADAVYAGQPRYSLRVRENEFNHLENLATGISAAHAQNKQFYLASNIAAHNDKVRTYLRDLEPVIEMGPDALIMSDPGLIMLVRERWPEQQIHLSVQANATNWATVKFWQSQGISRVILSRELGLEEIAEIRQRCPDMELETFVHGALCIAYSGRCLLSGYMTHRDANQGACTNTCRWQYKAQTAEVSATTGDLIPVQQQEPVRQSALLLEEQQRPGELMPAFEDEHGTYIMNSKDLRAVQHVASLMAMGVSSLKIEGRTKSIYYVARTAQVYRRAIDAAHAGKDFDMHWLAELDHLANRGYTEGFYRRHVPSAYQNYSAAGSQHVGGQYVGDVLAADKGKGRLLVAVKNRFQAGDELELVTPAGNSRFRLAALEDRNGHSVQVAPGSGHELWLQLPAQEEIQMLLGAAENCGLLVRCARAV